MQLLLRFTDLVLRLLIICLRSFLHELARAITFISDSCSVIIGAALDCASPLARFHSEHPKKNVLFAIADMIYCNMDSVTTRTARLSQRCMSALSLPAARSPAAYRTAQTWPDRGHGAAEHVSSQQTACPVKHGQFQTAQPLQRRGRDICRASTSPAAADGQQGERERLKVSSIAYAWVSATRSHRSCCMECNPAPLHSLQTYLTGSRSAQCMMVGDRDYDVRVYTSSSLADGAH